MPRDIWFTQLQHCVIFSSAISLERDEKLVFMKRSNGEGNCELWYFAIIIANVYKEPHGCSLLCCWWECNLR